MSTYLTASALAFVALFYALDRFGYLPKKKTSAEEAGELEIADRTIERLRHERNVALETVKRLEQTRSLEPILTQLGANAELQAQVLDRLVHHNGAFKHMEKSLEQVAEGLKMLTGFIAGVVDIPMKGKP